jgi:hypothetical protein
MAVAASAALEPVRAPEPPPPRIGFRETTPSRTVAASVAVREAPPHRPATPVSPAGREVTARMDPVLLDQRIAAAGNLLSEGRYEEALDLLDALHRVQPENDSLRRLTAEAEASFVDKAYRHWTPPDCIPTLTEPISALASKELTPSEFFLLSRVDGSWDVKSIIQVAPLREVEALRTLKRMRELGMIDMKQPD